MAAGRNRHTCPMRTLPALVSALLLVAACSSDGGVIDQSAGSDATPTAAAEPTPEPTGTPEPTSSDDGEPAEPTTEPVAEATPTPLETPTATPEPEPAGVVLPAGSYCYAGNDGINEMYARMTVSDSGEVSGDTRIYVSNDDEGYFTSAFQRFDGSFDADGSLDASLTTWIEYDIQESTETWIVSASGLQTPVSTVEEAPCDVVRDAYVDATLPGTDTGVTAEELLDRTFRVDERVSFDAGATSATVSNAVILGEADRYTLEVSGGQQMTVSITSLEDNAAVDVVSDSGLVLAVEVTSSEIFLPHSGDYFVIVSGTRGNATYDLTVTID